MKYLKYRDDFLNTKLDLTESELNSQIMSSEMINEVFENDIRFGDSLVGRFISSAIRVVGIGYKETKIPKLLEKLKGELDNLVTQSFQKDLSEKYNLLLIKIFMEKIKNISKSQQKDVDKLKELIGYEGTIMWDKENPTADIPGYFEGSTRRLLGKSYLQYVIDMVTDKLPNLEDFWGEDRNKFLDHLSDFSDALRKYTSVINKQEPGGNETSVSQFQARFGSAIHNLSTISDNLSINLSYSQFLLEGTTPAKPTTIKNFKELANKFNEEIDGKDLKPEEIQKLSSFQNLKNCFINLPEDKKNKLKAKKEEDGKTLFDTFSELLGVNKPEVATTQQTTQKNPELEKKYQELLAKWKASQKAAGKTNLNPGEGTRKSLMKQAEDELKNPQKPTTNPQKPVVQNPTEQKEGTEDVKKPEQKELTKKESIYWQLTNEEIDEPNDNETNEDSDEHENTDTESTVESKEKVSDIWYKFWGKWDEDESHRLTQREVEEMDKMLESNKDALYIDFTKRPDPIIAITRIFKRAHDLYYTEKIPSNRKDGMVSNATFRQYIYLGDGSASPANAGSYGPWLVKSIWSKWTDGVMQILEDQTYRKILAKINFVVPGSEDSFNIGKSQAKKESNLYQGYYRINELDERDKIGTTGDKISPTEKKSHGQILVDFIEDLIDQDQQKDFDKARRKLMKQYFGVVDKSIKEKKDKTGKDEKSGENEDLKWLKKDIKEFNDENIGNLFCFKTKDQRKTQDVGKEKLIFLQVLGFNPNKSLTYIKFTLDHQSIANKYAKNFNNTVESISKQSKEVNNVYFGVMKNKWTNNSLSITYYHIEGGNGVCEYGESNTNDKKCALGEPTAENGKNFDITDKPLRLTEKKTPIEIKTNDSLRIKSELSDSDLLGKTRDECRDSITSLIKKGKDWKFWN